MPDFNEFEKELKELENEIAQETVEQPVGDVQKQEDNASEKAVEQNTEGEQQEEVASAESEEDDIDEDAISDDAKRRARAFAKARQEKRELREKLEAEAKARQEIAERLARLEGRAEAAPKPEPKVDLADQEPDRDLYPEDHAQWELRQVKKQLEELKEFRKKQEQMTQFEAERRGVQALEGQFKQKAADYDDAVAFLVEKEKRVKKVMNPGATDAQLDALIEQEKVALFKQIYATGKNPAEVVYELAKADGWTGKKSSPTPAAKPSSNLDRVAENQRRAASLIGGSSADKTGKITSEQLLSMSVDELVRMPDSVWKQAEESIR